MADFQTGDRIVKMSGVNAGKFGTINSIGDSGTLNVTFDGEKLPRYCDPERCGKVAANAKFLAHWETKSGSRPARPLEYASESEAIRHVKKILAGNLMKGEKGWWKVWPEGEDPDQLYYDGKLKEGEIANSRAANAKFKVGQKVQLKGGKKTGVVTKDSPDIPEHAGDVMVRWDTYPFDVPVKESNLVALNSRVAANAKFKVGDIVVDKGFPSVKLRILQDDSRYNPNAHTYAVKPLRGGAVTTSREEDLKLANSRAANATVDPKVKAAYDKYMQTKAKFDKWWTPDRRLSERSKVVDEHQKAQMDFAMTFREVYGKPAPNGWSDMTLEQMVSKIG